MKIDKKLRIEHENKRKQLWIDVAVAIARVEVATSSEQMIRWANTALSEFDRQFPTREAK